MSSRRRTSGSAPEAITPDLVDFLASERGRAALASLSEADLAPAAAAGVIARLRRTLEPSEAGAVLTTAVLRRRAAAKFSDAHRLFFTAEALEQSTAEAVAAHRALRIDRLAVPGPILDLGCGIGGDMLAIARRRTVVAFERDPVRARIAQANAAALGLEGRVTVERADWAALLEAGTLPPAAAAFVDPSRRRDGRRVSDARAMEPPPAVLEALRARYPHLCVKARPSLSDAEIPAGAGVEFISHDGVCKEAVLWMGDLAHGPERLASVHAGGAWHAIAATAAPLPLGPIGPGDWLVEPDPAVIRARAVADLARRIGAHGIDGSIAYLVVPSSLELGAEPDGGEAAVGARSAPACEPFGRAFRVLEVLPFSLRALNGRLRALGVGQVELKKRGAPFEPESLRGRLDLEPGGPAAVVFFTRRGDERLTIIARREPSGSSDGEGAVETGGTSTGEGAVEPRAAPHRVRGGGARGGA